MSANGQDADDGNAPNTIVKGKGYLFFEPAYLGGPRKKGEQVCS
jgi:hypothetical protein